MFPNSKLKTKTNIKKNPKTLFLVVEVKLCGSTNLSYNLFAKEKISKYWTQVQHYPEFYFPPPILVV